MNFHFFFNLKFCKSYEYCTCFAYILQIKYKIDEWGNHWSVLKTSENLDELISGRLKLRGTDKRITGTKTDATEKEW